MERRKRVLDYPVMYRMLTDLFHETYERTLDGNSHKHRTGGPYLDK